MRADADERISDAAESCDVQGIHQDIVQPVLAEMPDTETIESLADFYKAFGDRTRLSIIWALGISEMCVCDLCEVLGMKQPAISHQLRILKNKRIVKARRDGKVVFYSIDDEHIREVLDVGRVHLDELS